MKRSWLSGLGILAMLLNFLFNPGTGHAQTGASGTVAAWGSNLEGQANVPPGLSDVTAISAGNYHSLALKGDGTIVTWGCVTKNNAPCTVPSGLSGVTAISAGGVHNLALRNDGTVVAWGNNTSGQTNVPAELSGVTAIAGGGWHSLALKGDGTVVAWGANGFGQVNVPAGLSGVIAIEAGTYHSLALQGDGTVVAWGYNDCGQINVPAGLNGVTAISGGDRYSLALKSDGTVVAWGDNSYDQTTVPVGLSGVTAISAGTSHSLALKNDGTVVAWGNNRMKQSTVPAGLSGVIAIAGGESHSLALAQTVPAGHYPVALDDSYSTNVNTALTVAAPGVLSNDMDEDGDQLSALIVRVPAHGTLTLNADGSFEYIPATNYTGQDSFTYRADDGDLGSNIATVSISVLPVAHHPSALDDSYSTNQNTALTVAAPGVLTNDTDEDGDQLSALLVSDPAHGTLTLNADGSFTYTPASSYAGADSFTYQANDGELASSVATVNITVSQTNHAPVALDQSLATPWNTPLAIILTATDVENSALTYTIVSGPTNGALSGAAPVITYTPNVGYAGPDSFTFKANDGAADSNVATVNISVFHVAHHPSALDDSYSTNQNTALTVAAPGVLSNDTDEDGDLLSVHLVSDPAHGTLTLNVDGSFDYMPATNYAGQDSFTYRAVDGELASNVATVSITVSQTNSAPVAIDDSYSVIANTILTVAAPGVLRNDTDADGNTLKAILVRRPAHGMLMLNAGGSFVYKPVRYYAGPDSFAYKVNDGQAGSNIATVSISIQYRFIGFFQPVDNPGPGPRYIFNTVKAGSAVPVRFSLAGYQGLSIFAPGYPTSTPVKCTTAARFDLIEQTVTAGNSSLSYNPASNTYIYAWKTEKKWAGTCRVLTVQFRDGTQRLAYFLFK